MLHHSGSQVLHTPRLVLRPYRSGDEQMAYANWLSDPIVASFLSWNAHASVDVSKQLIDMWVEAYESPTVYHWGIEHEGELIGDIAVSRWNEDRESCEIGYCLSRRFWNQGLMTEALSAVMDYLFDTVGFHRISLRHDIRNIASGRVMQKCGMRPEGITRGERRRADGSWADICNYGLLSEDRKS